MDERIVVGVDGSESSRRALGWATRQAKLTGALLDVVMAWEVPPAYRFDVSSPHDLRLGAETILQEVVADVVGDAPGVDVRPSVVEGHPVPVLLNAAQGVIAPCCRQPRPRCLHRNAARIRESSLRDTRDVPCHRGAG